MATSRWLRRLADEMLTLQGCTGCAGEETFRSGKDLELLKAVY